MQTTIPYNLKSVKRKGTKQRIVGAGCSSTWVNVTTPWCAQLPKCTKSNALIKKTKTGTSCGLMALFNVIDSIEWNLTRESIIFLAWMFWVGKICLREIWLGCKRDFQRITTSFRRLGSCHQNTQTLENSLNPSRRTKRRHS